MSKGPPSPPPPLNLSSDRAVATGHLQTFKLSVIKEWYNEKEIVVPKKPVPRKGTYVKDKRITTRKKRISLSSYNNSI